MRYMLVIATSLLVSAALDVSAGTWVSTPPPGAAPVPEGETAKPSNAFVHVDAYDDAGLDLSAVIPGVELSQIETEAGTFVQVRCRGADLGGDEGLPGLPVLRRMLCAPEGAVLDVTVDRGEARVIDLAGIGFPYPVLPFQPLALAVPDFGDDQPPSQDKQPGPADGSVSHDSHKGPFQFQKSAYAADASLPEERAVVAEAGIMNWLHLHHLEVRPVAYNPARGQLTIWPELRVHIRFQGGKSGFDCNSLRRTSPVMKTVLNPPPLPAGGRSAETFLIITAQDLAGSAPLIQFAVAKMAQGFNVITHTVAVGTDRTQIRSYIQGLYSSRTPPDYLLIIGDAHLYDSTAVSNTVPAWMGGGANHCWTDLPYACMDAGDDWYPDIPFGRWALRTVSDLQNVVDKTLYVENGVYADPTYVRRATFLASPDPDAQAEAIQDEIISNYIEPNNIVARKLYYTLGATTADVTDSFNDGNFLTIFFGHSAIDRWHTPEFTFDDIDALSNVNLYPLIISYSCNPSAFAFDPYEPILHEKFLRVGNKSGCACYGPTYGRVYDWSTWRDVYRYDMAAIYGGGQRILSPAFQTGMATFITAYGPTAPVSRDYAEMFELLGDPSMSLPRPPAKNYLVVTPPAFVGSAPLNQLIALRQNRGFNVTTYTVASGTPNTAIKAHIVSLWGTAEAPDYVVIIGDTNGSTSTSSTIPHFVGLGPRQGTTDWPYVCMDPGDDWYPEIPIGRLSVQTVSQLQTVVDKIVKVESGNFSDPDYVKRGTFLANSASDVAALAEATHNWVVDKYFTPNGYTATKVYGSLGGTTAQVAAAVNAGCLWTVYMGHSADTGWWNPQFYQSDVNALTNNGLYGLAMGWSCHTAQYELPECFGETWLRAANKGAAAYISASQFIYWGDAESWAPSVACEKAFFASMFDDGNWEIGPAWLNGMYRFLKDYGGWDGVSGHTPPLHADKCRDFMEEFVILGDPAMELPRPFGFTLQVDPASMEVCSPPATQAGFNIQVGSIGGFDEPVTLSAAGTPSGTVVQFSDNLEVPPFSSVMTISNLTGASAGKYTITITGASASKTRSTTVSLAVSNAMPAVPVLVSPPDGAVGQARQPTLTWQAAAQANTYFLQVATDVGFSQVVYSKTLTGTSHTLESMLTGATQYFWRLRASNGCGQSEFCTPFHFTTIAQADYFTQQFTGSPGFDLAYFTIKFIPDGSASFYRMCGDPATTLPSDPSGGTTMSVSEDGYVQVTPGRQVWLYGTAYNNFYVNENGNITFGSGDSTWQETLAIHFSKPRIAPAFNDFTPTAGTRSWKSFSDHIAVSWVGIPEWGASNQSTFQVEMFNNGEIHMTWLRVDATTPIVGLSRGLGIPSDFIQSDLSGATTCIVRGACCNGQTCTFVTQAQCTAGGGIYHGDGTGCTPNPCIDYNEDCVIISEVVDATLSGGCPKFIEITNTAATDFVFLEGGIIIQHSSDSDVNVDVNLTGVTIPAGQSLVVNSNHNGTCTGAFQGAYGFPADIDTMTTFGDGDDRYILTDKADGSHLLDIYGEFGVDGTGRCWEYTKSYAYRRPAYTCGRSTHFAAQEWTFGGVGALDGFDSEYLLQLYTTPGTHTFTETCTGPDNRGDMNCDWYLNAADINLFITAILNPAQFTGCDIMRGDINRDGQVNMNDCQPFVNRMLGL